MMEKHTSRSPNNKGSGESANASGRAPDRDRKTSPHGIPPLEWAVAALGLALVLAVAVFLGVHGYADRRSPPDISLRAESVVELRSGFLVSVQAVNTGGKTAGAVTVEGVLRNSSGVAETSQMSFQYLPPNSPRTGGLFFTRDPLQYTLTLRPMGYEAP